MYKYLSIIVITLSFSGFSQTKKKNLTATRINSSIHIDGNIMEPEWNDAFIASNFCQLDPVNGEPSAYKSEVKILYSDYAIYIGAYLYDNKPDSIMKQLVNRDEVGQADFFGISIDPFNDGLNGYTFIVTSANIQFDARQSSFEDSSWDAVWVSEVSIKKDGWVVEMEIPYSALRFPKKEEQIWGLNIVRNVQRTREKSFWNNVDKNIDGYLKQAGILSGIKNIEPPIRLSITPYISGYVNKNSKNSGFDYSLKGGLDLKYGINESYTLDMMVIPDFGQVESDDEVLNISPYETYYQEKRPFFTEGIELFNKGDIFYSRRIGTTPDTYDDIILDTNEIVTKNPTETQLINLTKISGKGKNGMGFGFLNGMSLQSEATIEDTLKRIAGTNYQRKAVTQPFTNYNVLVLDQSLKNNSYLSFTNTNYYKPVVNYMSNVSATEFKLENASGSYALYGILGGSYIKDESNSKGYKYYLELEKIKGNFRFGINQSLASKEFNPNDMGYLDKTDELQTEIELNYNIYKPFWKVLQWYNDIQYTQNTLFSEKENVSNTIFMNTFTTFKNYLSANLWSEFSLGEINNYNEPRVDGRFFKSPGFYRIGGFLSPDYRKKFVVDVNFGFVNYHVKNQYGYWLGLSPMIRFNDHLNLTLSTYLENDKNNRGYIDNTEVGDSIYFGQRDINTLINSLKANYVFNSKASISFRLRHYWRTIAYENYYLLQENGIIKRTSDYSTNNINSNYFNIDMIYTWRFAPGSELSLVWKYAVSGDDEYLVSNYFKNVNNLFDFQNNNSISFRLVYYIDYLKLKKSIK
ncbi:MAG: carbohydrate binding family 9 domain-containing protein [Salinivirgaceae bacterium]|nr:carbohydrate binding family 9 domain-containing protein [Salinivirgaceae bacterium]